MDELTKFMPEINKLDYYINKFLPEYHRSALEWILYILDGNTIFHPSDLIKKSYEMIKNNMQEWRELFVSIILLFVISASMTAFMEAFKSASAVKTSKLLFLICELLVLIHIWRQIEDIAKSSMQQLLDFMKIAMPALMSCIAITGHMTTAVVFQKIILGSICVIEGMILSGIFALLKIYIAFAVVEIVTGEGRFAALLDVIRKTIKLVTKACVVVISASQSLQILITPIIDKTNVNLLKKTASAIPGIGDITESVTSITLASMIAVKNSFGVMILVIIMIITITPVIKIFALVWTIKLGGAIGSICGDSYMMKGITYISEAGVLALRLLIMFTTLFLVTVAMLTSTTGGAI